MHMILCAREWPQAVYMKKIKEVEEAFHFPRFHSPCLGPADFAAKPSVLLLGQYSTGALLHRPSHAGLERPAAS